MILIFGGAYQGKKEFARSKWNLADSDILDIREAVGEIEVKNDHDLYYSAENIMNTIGRTAPCIYGLDQFIRLAVYSGRNVDAWLDSWMEGLDDKIIIMNDVSQGLVPMDMEDRFVREANGRCMIKLAKAADRVYRVFAGIATEIK